MTELRKEYALALFELSVEEGMHVRVLMGQTPRHRSFPAEFSFYTSGMTFSECHYLLLF